jgi:glucose-6-phosphate 1-dehydrogenase
MTFRALYRLECHDLLNCPVLGVASDDITVEGLISLARESIESTGENVDHAAFDRLAGRFGA